MITRHLNLFEKILLPIAVLFGIFGFYLISQAHETTEWLGLIAVFGWLSVILLMIIAATNEDVKEELGVVIKEHIKETKLLREQTNEIISELKHTRESFKKKL